MEEFLSDTNFLFSLIGFFSFLIGVYLQQQRNKLKKTGLRTMGTVEDIVYKGKYGYPLVSFDLPNGKTVAYKSDTGDYVTIGFKTKSRYYKGQNIPIVYSLDEPKKFIIDDRGSDLKQWLFIGLGSIFMIVSIYNLMFK